MPHIRSRELTGFGTNWRGRIPRKLAAELAERFCRHNTGRMGFAAEMLPVCCRLLPEKTSRVVAAAAAAKVPSKRQKIVAYFEIAAGGEGGAAANLEGEDLPKPAI